MSGKAGVAVGGVIGGVIGGREKAEDEKDLLCRLGWRMAVTQLIPDAGGPLRVSDATGL